MADDLNPLPLLGKKRTLVCLDMSAKSSRVNQGISGKDWPGLPRGVKFEPSDEDLLWHLLAEIGKGGIKPHPFINNFIISLGDDYLQGTVLPQFLPGVKQDGSNSYFFHKKIDKHKNRQIKRKKMRGNSFEACWCWVGKSKQVCIDGIHQGFKEVFSLHICPENDGNFLKTPWLMYQYHFDIDGADDRAVSKFFYEMRSKQGIPDSQMGFTESSVTVYSPIIHQEVEHGLENERNAVHAGSKKSFSFQKSYTKEKDSFIEVSECILATAEISISPTREIHEISVTDQNAGAVENITDDFLGNLDDSANTINFTNYVGKADEACDSSDPQFSNKKSCPERDSIDNCLVTGYMSMNKHDAHSKCLDEVIVSVGSISSVYQNISNENIINDVVLNGLPENAVKDILSEENENKYDFKKICNNSVSISAHPVMPIAMDANTSNLLIKEETFEYGTGYIVEKVIEKLPSSQFSCLVNSFRTDNFCSSKTGIQKNYIPHLSSHQANFTEDPNLSTVTSSLDDLVPETAVLVSQHSEGDGNTHIGLLFSNDNSDVILDSECLNQSIYPNNKIHSGERCSNMISSSISLNDKSEAVDNSFHACLQVPCNAGGLASLKFNSETELPSDFSRDTLDHIPLKKRLGFFSKMNAKTNSWSFSEGIAQETSISPMNYAKTKECRSSGTRKRKKTSTDSVEKAMEEDAPGLLQFLLDRGIQIEEIKLYADLEDADPLEHSSFDDGFEQLETVLNKLFFERSSLLRLASRRSMKVSRAYCLACLISLIEQARYLHFRQAPIEWGWCRDLQSFIFIFQEHNRIVLERPEYGYATYFFELVASLPIDWQIKRLVMAMKLTNCSRTTLLENKMLNVGEDLSEGEACVLEAYGWTRNTGFGTLLSYCDRVMHDRRTEMYISEWRAKIRKLLMNGYDGGRIVLTRIPHKAVKYMRSQHSDIKMEI